MTDRTYYWHPLTSQYLHARAWAEICNQPPTIVAACNRVNRKYERALSRDGRWERSLSIEWWKGIAYALSAVLVAGSAVWVLMW